MYCHCAYKEGGTRFHVLTGQRSRGWGQDEDGTSSAEQDHPPHPARHGGFARGRLCHANTRLRVFPLPKSFVMTSQHLCHYTSPLIFQRSGSDGWMLL